VNDVFGMAAITAPLALARSLPLALLVPLTGRFVPTTVALSLVVSIAAPGLFGLEQPRALAGGDWLVAVFRELGLGLTFALASAVPLLAAASTGGLIDHWHRSKSRASGSHAALYELVALLSFFELGGHRAWFASYSRTLIDVPLGELAFARVLFLEGVLTIGGDAIALSLSLALPLLVSLWFCELGFALLQRASSGAAVSLLEFVRPVLSALLVIVTAPLLIEALPQATRTALSSARSLIGSVFG
jgi:type III secretory pathway component EscT